MSMSIKSGGSYQLDPITGELVLIETTAPDETPVPEVVAPATWPDAVDPDAPDAAPTAEQAAAAELDGPVLTGSETTTEPTEEPLQ